MENTKTNSLDEKYAQYRDQMFNKELVDGIEKILPKSCLSECFEAQVGKGWHSLVYSLCQDIKELYEKNEIPIEEMKIRQIKEKFGGLRFYPNIPDERIRRQVIPIVLLAEEKSFKICESCSSENGVAVRKNKDKFNIQTLCAECREKQEGNEDGNV